MTYVWTPAAFIHSTGSWLAYALLLGAAGAAVVRQHSGMLRYAAIGFTGLAVLALVLYTFELSRFDRGELSVHPGDPFPEFALQSSTGEPFSSAQTRGRSAALYIFYRGGWCPFCVAELAGLRHYYRQIEGQRVKLFAISTDSADESERLRKHLKLGFTFLSDPDGKVLDLLNIRHRSARQDGGDIAYPTQVLVDADGVVRWTYESEYERLRARPEQVLEAIAALTR
jgi:peroxiredoxin